MSSGRVIVRACWGGTCAMDGWNRRGRCLVAPRIDVDRGAKRRGGGPRGGGGPPVWWGPPPPCYGVMAVMGPSPWDHTPV